MSSINRKKIAVRCDKIVIKRYKLLIYIGAILLGGGCSIQLSYRGMIRDNEMQYALLQD